MKKISAIAASLTFFLPASAALAERGEPREIHDDSNTRRHCRNDLIPGCISQYRAAADAERANALALDPRISAASGDITALGLTRSSVATELVSMEEEIKSLEAEANFLETPAAKPAAAVIPGFLPLENFFTLHSIERDWRDRYSADRLKQLSVHLREARQSKTHLDDRLSQIAGEIEQLNNKHRTFLTEKNSLLNLAHQHESMCDSGCAMQHCP